MNRSFFLFVVLLSASIARAEPLTVSRKVVLADGTPAVKADVLVRSIDNRSGTALAETTVQTGDDGVFSAQLDVLDAKNPSGFVLVRFPGKAILLAPLISYANGVVDTQTPFKLISGAHIHGTVKDVAGAVVAGALVEIASFSDDATESEWFFNSLKSASKTPWLQTTSDAAGNYSLRPVVFSRDPSGLSTFVMAARKDIAGNLAKGRADVSPYTMLAHPDQTLDFTLRPTDTVRGHVQNLVTGAPVAGATVELKGFLSEDVPEVKSDATGAWEMKGLPHTQPLFAFVSAPDYGDNYVRLTGEEGHLNTTDATIALPPLVEVAGVAFDAVTGKSAVVPLSLRTWPPEGFNDGNFSVHARDLRGTVGADGRFSIRVPAGTTRFDIGGTGYESDISLEVPAQGLRDLKWPVKRKNGVLLDIQTKNPLGLEHAFMNLRVGGKGGQGLSGPRFDFIWDYNLKDGAEIHVVRYDEATKKETEVVPWTKIDANEKRWPLVINVP